MPVWLPQLRPHRPICETDRVADHLAPEGRLARASARLLMSGCSVAPNFDVKHMTCNSKGGPQLICNAFMSRSNC